MTIVMVVGCGQAPTTRPVDLTGQIGLQAIIHGDDKKAIESIRAAATMAFPRGYRLALHDAAGMGRVQVVRAFIKAGVDVDARDEFGKTPLMACAGFWSNGSSQDHLEVARLLLEHGANPDAKAFQGDPIIYDFKEPFTVDDILDRHVPGWRTTALKKLLVQHRMRRMDSSTVKEKSGPD